MARTWTDAQKAEASARYRAKQEAVAVVVEDLPAPTTVNSQATAQPDEHDLRTRVSVLAANSDPDTEHNPSIAELMAEIASLRKEMADQATRVPTFRKMEKVDLHNATTRRAQVLRTLEKGQSAGGQLQQVPVDHLGHKLSEPLMRLMANKFNAGDEVMIVRSSAREGFKEGVTWGDVLDRANCVGVGTVHKVLWFGKGDVWKYKVRVPGLTGASADGFHEYELAAV